MVFRFLFFFSFLLLASNAAFSSDGEYEEPLSQDFSATQRVGASGDLMRLVFSFLGPEELMLQVRLTSKNTLDLLNRVLHLSEINKNFIDKNPGDIASLLGYRDEQGVWRQESMKQVSFFRYYLYSYFYFSDYPKLLRRYEGVSNELLSYKVLKELSDYASSDERSQFIRGKILSIKKRLSQENLCLKVTVKLASQPSQFKEFELEGVLESDSLSHILFSNKQLFFVSGAQETAISSNFLGSIESFFSAEHTEIRMSVHPSRGSVITYFLQLKKIEEKEI